MERIGWKEICKISFIYCPSLLGKLFILWGYPINETVMLPGVNLSEFIVTIGYIGLFAVIFAETGLFLGFFLPGDSLLFVAGLLASGSTFSPALLMIVFVAAVLGNVTGVRIWTSCRDIAFSREESVLFKKSHVRRAEDFFNRYGAKTIVLA